MDRRQHEKVKSMVHLYVTPAWNGTIREEAERGERSIDSPTVEAVDSSDNHRRHKVEQRSATSPPSVLQLQRRIFSYEQQLKEKEDIIARLLNNQKIITSYYTDYDPNEVASVDKTTSEPIARDRSQPSKSLPNNKRATIRDRDTLEDRNAAGNYVSMKDGYSTMYYDDAQHLPTQDQHNVDITSYPSGQTVKEKMMRVHNHDHHLSIVSPFRDWNEEYQTWYHRLVSIMNQQKNPYKLRMDHEVLYNINRVAQQFADTATIYAKIIISEFELPLERKTIKPINIGGVAGGTKYRVQNILYKFAFDTTLSNDPPLWMYGGESADHRAAAKAAKNEMKGLEAHSCCYVEGLSYPMMTLVDYLGFRVIAMAILPIDQDTLVYGSGDAGMTVRAVDVEMNEKMKQVAQRLNLRGHVTGSRSTTSNFIFGPGDIEGHRGHDGRLYVIDFGRLMPPEDPRERLQKKNRSVFYELLRPEMVLSNPISLCSDAFTRWNSDPSETERKKINEQVMDASRRLREINIPLLANNSNILAPLWDSVVRSPFDRELLETVDFMMTSAHSLGMSLRHLGIFYRRTIDPNLKKIISSAAVSRCAKSDLQEILRLKMREVRAPSDEDFKEVVAQFLNQLAGNSDSSRLYYRRDLCKQMRDWFQFELTPEQMQDFDPAVTGDIRLIINIVILRSSMRERVSTPGDRKKFLFITSDIDNISAKTRHRSDIYFSAGLIAMNKTEVVQTDHAAADHDKSIIRRQVEMAVVHFRRAANANPASSLYPTAWAAALLEQARLSEDHVDEYVYHRIFIFLWRSFAVWPDCPGRRENMEDVLNMYARYCEKRGWKEKEGKLMALAEKMREGELMPDPTEVVLSPVE
ncbi:hypothetical protein PROFUN_09893 [Planoprotostelium fungivorum]|uniref:Clu domain-containing protein n=1 Tax=Planoprotostelium fungivorum TaxID=1890364 RepID=A0A2P6NGF0_9EUKA|nr:hypothetical protein PROFUN_09893 [Planoprotostelium fungivorum]